MSMFNLIHADVICPRCGVEVRIMAQCWLGYTGDCKDIKIGDEYPFWPDEFLTPGRLFTEDGYAECPACNLDFGVCVIVEHQVVQAVRPEPLTLVHIVDGILNAAVLCPGCGATGEKEIKLYNGVRPATYRLGDVYAEGARYVGRAGWIRGRAYCEMECPTIYFAAKIFMKAGVLDSVAIDPHQKDAAEGLE